MGFLSFFPLKTWLLIGGGVAVVIGGLWFYGHYQHLVSEAAKVSALQARIVSDDNRAAALADKFARADAARIQADRDLSQWQGERDALLTTLKETSRATAAVKNPVCAPSADDRRMWNATVSRLLAGSGQSGKAGGVPVASGPPH